tara:strand:+ start:2605 stop:3186 length:582 start_codon:yes stop_codon:yes gene_type:complete
MGWGILGSAVLGALKGASQRRALNKQYQLASAETEAEKEYRLKLEKAKLEGDPDIHKKRQSVYSPIMSYGQSAKADATGVAIRQGLENSIIAHEIRNKIDDKTFQMINEQADKIAEYNEKYKKEADAKLMDYKMRRDARLRDLAVGHSSAMSSTSTFGSALLDLGSQWITGKLNAKIGDGNWFNYTGENPLDR